MRQIVLNIFHAVFACRANVSECFDSPPRRREYVTGISITRQRSCSAAHIISGEKAGPVSDNLPRMRSNVVRVSAR